MTNRQYVLPAIVVLVLAGSNTVLAQDGTLGRLFYTTEERAALDQNIRSITKEPESLVPIPPSVTLSGVVMRSDGERTVWIDGRAYYQGNPKDVRVITRPADPGAAEIKVQGIPRRLPVRVGQRVDPASGKTFEPYEVPPPSAQKQIPQPVPTKSGAEPALEDPVSD